MHMFQFPNTVVKKLAGSLFVKFSFNKTESFLLTLEEVNI